MIETMTNKAQYVWVYKFKIMASLSPPLSPFLIGSTVFYWSKKGHFVRLKRNSPLDFRAKYFFSGFYYLNIIIFSWELKIES